MGNGTANNALRLEVPIAFSRAGRVVRLDPSPPRGLGLPMDSSTQRIRRVATSSLLHRAWRARYPHAQETSSPPLPFSPLVFSPLGATTHESWLCTELGWTTTNIALRLPTSWWVHMQCKRVVLACLASLLRRIRCCPPRSGGCTDTPAEKRKKEQNHACGSMVARATSPALLRLISVVTAFSTATDEEGRVTYRV
ncbi:hypothetical protein LX36DRAFT_22071 [Colletotrichum falcatum]|nr:hypothetical protein LX36DRAFT_22071 [Colletotrichum falcatum]